MLCRYADIFGKADTGMHSFKIAGLAVVDVGLTLALACYLSRKYNRPLWSVAAGLFCLGIVAHRVFCVPTTVDRLLFD